MRSLRSMSFVPLAGTLAILTACTGNPLQQQVDKVQTQITQAVTKFTGLLKSESAVLAGYVAIAQDTKTKEIISSLVGADGKFELDFKQGATYVTSFLDSNANYKGTLAAAAGTDAVTTGFLAAEVGEILLAGTGQATAADASKLQKDDAIKGAASNGVGVGFSLGGLASQAYSTFKNTVDADGDGIPDYLDPDALNTGVRNSIDPNRKSGKPFGQPDYKTVNSFLFFTNYGTRIGEAPTPEAYSITIDIQAKPEYYAKFKEGQLILGPSYTDRLRFEKFDPNNGSGVIQPGLWKDVGKALYPYQRQGDTVQRITAIILGTSDMNMATTMKVGDVYRFRLTYTDGTTETLTNTIDTIFNTVPGNVKVNSAAASSNTATQVSTAPTLSWDRLKDESGNPLAGLTYAVEIAEFDTSSQNPVPGTNKHLDLGTDAQSFNWANYVAHADPNQRVAFVSGKTYTIDIKAQAPGGVTTAGRILVKAL